MSLLALLFVHVVVVAVGSSNKPNDKTNTSVVVTSIYIRKPVVYKV